MNGTLEIYREALAKIADLANKTRKRDAFTGCFCPESALDAEGFEPMHPEMIRAFQYAANIANTALRAEAMAVAVIPGNAAAVDVQTPHDDFEYLPNCDCQYCNTIRNARNEGRTVILHAPS